MYKCNSARDRGTLYHLRNLINRRNVVKKPASAQDECEDFFLCVVKAHVLSAAMTVYGMNTTESIPTNHQYFPRSCEELTPENRNKIFLLATEHIVDKYVCLPSIYRSKMLKSKPISNPKKGRKTSSETPYKSSMDSVLQYASEVLSLGLLLIEFNNAIHEGDGDRIIRCWKYFLIIFKATGRKNYTIEAFKLLLQLNFVFTPRMCVQLK